MTDYSVVVDGVAPARERRSFAGRLLSGVMPTRTTPIVVQAALPVFAFAALSMVAIDPAVALLMKSHVAGGLERVMRVVSDFGIGTGYIVAAAIGLVAAPILRRAKLVPLREAMLAKLQRFSLLALLGFAASGAVVNLTKLLVGRHRPRDLFDHAQYGFEPFRFLHGVDGFPSGHSQTIFVVATVLSLAMPKYWRSFAAAGTLVAASRVIMTNHYLSDVVVGSYVGIAAVLLIAPYILKDGDAPRLRA